METKSVLNYNQTRFSKWLFAAILLLSFFTFSGLELRTQQTSSDTQQTSFLQTKPVLQNDDDRAIA